ALKEGIKFSSGKLPPHEKRPTQAAAPVVRRMPPARAATPATPASTSTLGIIVLAVGVGILAAGAFFALKGREDPAKPAEKPPPPDTTNVTPPGDKPGPVIEAPPPQKVDAEKAADEEYTALTKGAAS